MSRPIFPSHNAILECGHKRSVTSLVHVGDYVFCFECPENPHPQGKQSKYPDRRVTKMWWFGEKEPTEPQEDGILQAIKKMYCEPGRDYKYEVQRYWDHTGSGPFYLKVYRSTCYIKQDFSPWNIIALCDFATNVQAEHYGRSYLKRRGPSGQEWQIKKALREGRVWLDGTPFTFPLNQPAPPVEPEEPIVKNGSRLINWLRG